MVRKLILILVFFVLIFVSSFNAVRAAGGFYFLDNWDAPSGPSITGGTVLLDWRDFEPVEGQYRWELLTSVSGTYTSWFDTFSARELNRNFDSRPMPGQIIHNSYNANPRKKLRLKLKITEGALPLWLYGGEDANGKSTNNYHTTVCAHKEGPDNNFDCSPNTNIAMAFAWPIYPQKEDNVEPVWWNPIFQQKLRTVLAVIGQKIESDTVLYNTIEFVEASLGSYGETILYGKTDTGQTNTLNQQMFRAAGFTNAAYSQSIQTNIDSYFQGFKKLPVAVSLGSGLYSSPYDDGSGVLSVLDDFVPKIEAKYGSRLYLKFAGFSTECKGWVGNYFRAKCPDNGKCIYESAGGIGGWTGWPWGGDPAKLESIFKCALDHNAYIIMMWTGDFKYMSETGNNSLLTAFSNTLPKLQAIGGEVPMPPPSGGVTPPPVSPVNSISGPRCTNTAAVALTLLADPVPKSEPVAGKGNMRILSKPDTAIPAPGDFGPEHCSNLIPPGGLTPTPGIHSYCASYTGTVNWKFSGPGQKSVWAIFYNEPQGVNDQATSYWGGYNGWSYPVDVEVNYSSDCTASCSKGTAGDADCSGKVDGIDYSIWWGNFGKRVTNGFHGGDFNGNGLVDGVDYSIWFNGFGK